MGGVIRNNYACKRIIRNLGPCPRSMLPIIHPAKKFQTSISTSTKRGDISTQVHMFTFKNTLLCGIPSKKPGCVHTLDSGLGGIGSRVWGSGLTRIRRHAGRPRSMEASPGCPPGTARPEVARVHWPTPWRPQVGPRGGEGYTAHDVQPGVHSRRHSEGVPLWK